MTVCGEKRNYFFMLYVHCCSHKCLHDLQRPLVCFSLNMAPFGVKVACIEPGFFSTNVTDTGLLKNSLKQIWDRLPQDLKDDYGHNFLETCELLRIFINGYAKFKKVI